MSMRILVDKNIPFPHQTPSNANRTNKQMNATNILRSSLAAVAPSKAEKTGVIGPMVAPPATAKQPKLPMDNFAVAEVFKLEHAFEVYDFDADGVLDQVNNTLLGMPTYFF